MNTSDTEERPRAGFWRRALSSIIDLIIVATPFQVIVVVLFATTGGSIQMTGNGLVVQACEQRTSVPVGLTPSPPQNSNFATECRISFFGLPTGHVLVVGHAERTGGVIRTTFRRYMLNAASEPIQGVSIDGYVFLVLVAYVIALTARSGQTLGAKLLRIRVVDVARRESERVPIRKIVIRYAAMLIGLIPTVIVVLLSLYRQREAATSNDWISAGQIIFGVMTAASWTLVLIIQMALKQDPVYDWLAGTTVIRLPAQERTSASEQPLPS